MFRITSWALVFLLLAAGLALIWCLLWMAFSGLSVAFVDSFLPAYPTAGNFAVAFVDDGLGLALLNTLMVAATTAALRGLGIFPAATRLAEQTLATAALVILVYLYHSVPIALFSLSAFLSAWNGFFAPWYFWTLTPSTRLPSCYTLMWDP